MKRLNAAAFACLLMTGAALAQEEGTLDRAFADAMSAHHEDGIKMADLASRKAASASLREKAAKMITDQRNDISELQRLRGDGPMTEPQEMAKLPGMMASSAMERDLARLEAASGEEFDAAFGEIMARHHAGAIEMSEHYLTTGSNDGLKAVARQIIDKQTHERSELAALHSHEDSHEHDAAPAATSMPRETEPRARMRKD